MSEPVRFFSISSPEYFPGFVGMLNSLRLSGHHEPITVLERGWSQAQRRAMPADVQVVSRPERVSNPCHLTAYPHDMGFEGIVVFVDADALVLRRLDRAIEAARDGFVCLHRDPDDGRFFEQWSDIFELRSPLRRQPYFNTGLVAFSTLAHPLLLRRWWEALSRIWHLPSFMEGASMTRDPTSQPDQDALNALLMSEYPEGTVHELGAADTVFPARLVDVEIVDEGELTCTLDGHTVSIVQCSGSPKPWMWAGVWRRIDSHAYLPLLRRCLASPDAPVRPDRALLPLWLREGRRGEAAFETVRLLTSTPLRRVPRTLWSKIARWTAQPASVRTRSRPRT